MEAIQAAVLSGGITAILFLAPAIGYHWYKSAEAVLSQFESFRR